MRVAEAGTSGRHSRVAAADPMSRGILALLGAIALSLVVASALHLSGHVRGRGAPFDADHAGVAEAVIAVALGAATIGLWRAGVRARRPALWACGFAIAGFCWGLSITSQGGHWPDIAYHLVVLPLLVVSFAGLLRTGRVTSGP
jgi:hypothetical protein